MSDDGRWGPGDDLSPYDAIKAFADRAQSQDYKARVDYPGTPVGLTSYAVEYAPVLSASKLLPPRLTDLDQKTIDELAAALPPLRQPFIYARILWDGVNGEPERIRLTWRLFRLIQRAQRRRARYPAHYRQFYPKRLKRG